MKIESMINVRLMEEEVKEAVLYWLSNKIDPIYYEHICSNNFTLDSDGDDIILIIDGVVKDDDVSW